MATAAASAKHRKPPPASRKWVVLAVVLLAEVMDLLDSTITGVAAPTIRADLQAPASLVQWLASGYTLPFAALLVTFGRLGDMVSQRALFVAGALGFAVASLGAAAAPGPGWLIAARCAQGACAALLVPQGFGLIRTVFPPRQIRVAYSFFGPVLGGAAVCGPIVGGLLAETDIAGLQWRVIFLLTVPIGVFAALGAVAFVPSVALPERSSRPRIDVRGTLLVAVGMLAVVYPLIEGRDLGWPWWGFAAVAAGTSVLIGLPVYWRRTRGPKLVDPSLFGNRSYCSGIVVVLGFLGAFAGLLLVVSLYCQTGLGFSAVRAGLTIAPIAVGMALASPIAAALATTHGRRVIRCGLAVAALGCAGLAVEVSYFGAARTLWSLAPLLLVTGVGIGLVFAPLFDLILSGVTPAQTGSASGVLNASQQLAAALGVAGLATIYLDVQARSAGTGFAVALLATAGGFVLAGMLARSLPARSFEDEELVDGKLEDGKLEDGKFRDGKLEDGADDPTVVPIEIHPAAHRADERVAA